jgi:ectoine hydroxylase-related dioxygenase (phytanoyl-CoA dioxygenase family)
MKHYTDQEFGAYKNQLDVDGYVVVKNVVSKERAKQFQDGFFDYLEHLNPHIKRTDPKTWRGDNFPHTNHGLFHHNNVGHIMPLWEARVEPGMLEFYQRFWNCEDLLVSYNGACFLPSHGKGISGSKEWFHTDQGYELRMNKETEKVVGKHLNLKDPTHNFMSLQSILNLEDNGSRDGGFYVLPGSHKTHKKFYEETEQVDYQENWYLYMNPPKDKSNPENLSKEDLEKRVEERHNELTRAGKEYLSQFKRVKVNLEAGDAIFFYSRTAHCNVPTEPDSERFRMTFNISYMPLSFASEADLRKRKTALHDLRTTSHWACINLKLNPLQPHCWDNKEREALKNFDSGFVKNELNLTRKMLQLTGLSKSEMELYLKGDDTWYSGQNKMDSYFGPSVAAKRKRATEDSVSKRAK